MKNNIDYQQVANELEKERIKIIQSLNHDDIISGIEKIIGYAKNIPVKDIGKGGQVVSIKEEMKQKELVYLAAIIERIKQNFYSSTEGMYIDISLTISGLIINITHLPLSEIQN
jgi:hypothetical protein